MNTLLGDCKCGKCVIFIRNISVGYGRTLLLKGTCILEQKTKLSLFVSKKRRTKPVQRLNQFHAGATGHTDDVYN